MSNPPAGWYPDPTGQPDTIRWWNGTQWTNKTEKDGPAAEETEAVESAPAQSGPVQNGPKLTLAPEPFSTATAAAGEPPAEEPQQPVAGADAWTAGSQQQGGVEAWTGGQQNVSGQWAPNAIQQATPIRDDSGSGWGPTGQQQSGGAAQWGRSGTQQQWQGAPQGSGVQGGVVQGRGVQGSGGQGGSGGQSGQGGSGGGGARTPLIIAGAAALVVLIVAAVFYVTQQGDDTTSEPTTSPSPQSSTSTQTSAPTSGPTAPATTPGTEPGQSKNPKLHEGDNRVSSDAISFPRQRPPWSERKRLIPQLLNSSGQYVLLQEKYDGKSNWYADVFVGALGTATPFNGDPKATARDLLSQVHSSMYGSVSATFKPIGDGAVKRSDKSGWYYQETVTVNSPKLTTPVLTLTVAVFDLGDGTAVAYISDIPTNRPDLKKAESQAYKGINVG